jgi:NAD(P)-dependent dehydrogenase (short-subunit alcohol dehydrogenase family)
MAGTVLFTGANGSLALPAVKQLLKSYPSLTLVLTVRDESEQDPNTATLHRLVSQFSDASVSIRKLDLVSLEAVTSFSNVLLSEINNGKIPRLVAIICNAFTWSLSGGPKYSKDGYETSMAINHLAHFSLSLRLLGALDPQHGRIVFLGSEAHRPEPGPFNKGFPTHIPKDLDLLVHSQPDKKKEELARGFQRYGVSKLVIIMVMYELNRRLKTVRTCSIGPFRRANDWCRTRTRSLSARLPSILWVLSIPERFYTAMYPCL